MLLLQKHTKVEDSHLKRLRDDLQSRVDFLQKQANVSSRAFIFSLQLFTKILFSDWTGIWCVQSYDDKGPVIDAVVWNDGELWRVALDTQSLEDEPGKGKLADFVPLTNYRY